MSTSTVSNYDCIKYTFTSFTYTGSLKIVIFLVKPIEKEKKRIANGHPWGYMRRPFEKLRL